MSNKLNLLKPTLILPIFAFLLMSFSTKENKTKITNKMTIETIDKDIEVIVITKDFSKKDFENAKKECAKYNIKFTLYDLKRNIQGEIITIIAHYETPDGQENTMTVDCAFGIGTIHPLAIVYNEKSGKVSFGDILYYMDYPHSKKE